MMVDMRQVLSSRIMATESLLTLAELKKRAAELGYRRITRQEEGAHIVSLFHWNGVSTEAGRYFFHVRVWYVLEDNKVTARKRGSPDIHYWLS